jgi:RND family efflux transporter MFP subunit
MKPKQIEKGFNLIMFAAFALAAIVFISAPVAGCTKDSPKATSKHEHVQQYQCPMHPEIIRDSPGKCPICGMDLVPIKEEVKADAAEPAQAAKPADRKILFYRNPMNPRITSPVPAKDEMGMDYIAVYSDEAPSVSEVKGLAPVSIDKEGLRQAGIQTTAAEYGRLSRVIRTYGTVVPDETKVVRVNTKIAGWIDQLFVNFTYQKVKMGQPILSIYSPELLASQREFIEAIKSTGDVSGAEAKAGAAEILASARRKLELFDVPEDFISEVEKTMKPKKSVTLLSPADGYVTVKDVAKGQKIEAGTEIYTVTDLKGVWIEAAVYSNEAALIKTGQKAEICLPYEHGKTLVSEVAYIDPVLNPDARTLKVRINANSAMFNIKPGMFVDVILKVEPQQGIIIPDSAVIDTGARKIVYVLTGTGRFAPREVKTGLRSEGRVLISSGLAAGEMVAVRGNFLLDSESRIRGAIAEASKE